MSEVTYHQVTIEELEEQKRQFELMIRRKTLSQKLSLNPEFRELILEDFCEKECARYAQNSGNPALTPEARADCLGMAQAAGHLRRFLSVVIQMGNTAEDRMEEMEQALVEERQNAGE